MARVEPMLMIVPRRGRQFRDRRLDSQPRTFEIDRQGSIPKRLVGRFGRSPRTDPRAVHEEIQTSPTGGQIRHRAVPVGMFGDVEMLSDRLEPVSPQIGTPPA